MPPSPPEPDLATERARCAVCGSDEARLVGRTRDFEYASSALEFRYVRCAECGLVYLQNRPVPAELPRIYPPGYGNYEAGRQDALTFRVKSWLDARQVAALSRRAGGATRVLDVGCADGRLLDVCRAALPDATRLAGVEISQDAARGALERGYEVLVGTIDALELEAGAFDLIFLQQVIEHVYAPGPVLAKLGRALAPGGLLLVETPNARGLDFRWFQRRYWGGYHAPRHFHLFTADTLGRLCEDAGLEVAETRCSPQPIHWVWTLHHWLADRGAPGWTRSWLHLQNPVAIGLGTVAELLAGVATGQMSNLRVVARRPDR